MAPSPMALSCVHGAEVQRLQPMVCLQQAQTAAGDAVVFQQDDVVTLGEGVGDALAQRLAGRHRVRRVADHAAYPPRLGNDAGVRRLPGDAEGDERRRVGVDNGAQIGPPRKDRPMERQLRRRPVRADRRAVRPDADDVLGVSLPLSTPAGVIQMLSSSSRIDRLPPDRVVIPLRRR